MTGCSRLRSALRTTYIEKCVSCFSKVPSGFPENHCRLGFPDCLLWFMFIIRIASQSGNHPTIPSNRPSIKQYFFHVMLFFFPHLSGEGCSILCMMTFLLRLPLPSSSSQTSSPSSSPDVNMDLQSAVGNAGPQQRAPDCSGQRRTSTGELCNAGP